MAGTVLEVLLAVYAVHALAKFSFFFLLSYRSRRRALDHAYAGRASASKTADSFLLLVCVLLAGLLAVRGADHVSFLTGLLVGMTLIQIYFHRFSEPLSEEQAPKPPNSPIKIMSYAIQAMPGRPWRELVLIAGLLLWSLYGLAM